MTNWGSLLTRITLLKVEIAEDKIIRADGLDVENV